ncbi:WD40-repeat-containing domain protein [Chytriomyces sp. MP71]|nr:WD40-repeat-containing domain protein [Chytriomyces sp. MP71]
MAASLQPRWFETISERPLYCSIPVQDAKGNTRIIAGGADHGLTELDAHKGTRTASLYSKTHGHSEWVTCVARVSPTQVASAGMDAKVCVWDLASVAPHTERQRGVQHVPVRACVDLVGHTGSVAALCGVDGAGLLASGGYDGSVRLWRVDAATCVAVLEQRGEEESGVQEAGRARVRTRPTPSNAVVGLNEFAGRLMCRTKSGLVNVFDLGTGEAMTCVQAHRGPVSALVPVSGEVFASAGVVDGAVRVFDLRVAEGRGRCVARMEGVHGGGGVTAMVRVGSYLGDGTDGGPVCLATCGGGGDAAVKILEMRGGGVGPQRIVKEVSQLVRQDARVMTCLPGQTSAKSPETISYALTSVPELDGVLVSWGDGCVQVMRNLTRHGVGATVPDRGPMNYCDNRNVYTPINGRRKSTSSQVLEISALSFSSNSTNDVVNLDTKIAGIRNAIRSFSVFSKPTVGALGVVGSGDDGIAIGWELRF